MIRSWRQLGCRLAANGSGRLSARKVLQQLRIKERSERLGHLEAVHGAVFADVELFEQPLINQSPDAWVGCEVLVGAVLRHLQGEIQRVLQVRDVSRCVRDRLPCLVNVPREPGHLALHEVERYRTGVVSLDQLGALFFGVLEPLLGSALVLGNLFALAFELLHDACADHLGPVGWQPQRAVEVLDGGLDFVQSYVFAGAGLALGQVRQADVVHVDATGLAGVLGVDEACAALTAEDRALEVVRVLALLLPGEAMG
ncbi:hypothetical protein QWI33_24455 [Glycomyces tritici]|uniref:Uncharacterized protein n=1 Tax=Glycomyces tritici TaxID=2665176 RepID=A0ABT7YQP3_9ACTN|nr:hypothetical protein [Glycomyces tritici]MDN3240901.1 hypothetical protein [Glycomyces tritici]MDN3242896.1 hypothetical protein [Glycomyces tritici]